MQSLSWRGALCASGPVVCTSGAPGFVTDALGIALDHLALVAREACVPDSCETAAVGEMVLGRLPPPEHCTNSVLRHSAGSWSFCEGASLLVLALWAGRRLHVWHMSSGLWSFSQGMQTVDAISVFSLCLDPAHWHLPERSIYISLEP